MDAHAKKVKDDILAAQMKASKAAFEMKTAEATGSLQAQTQSTLAVLQQATVKPNGGANAATQGVASGDLDQEADGVIGLAQSGSSGKQQSYTN